MHPNAFQYLTAHSRERLLQRTSVDAELVEAAVRGRRVIYAGNNQDDPESDLLVFYDLDSGLHYILVQNRKSQKIITVLFPDSERWIINADVVSRAKAAMEELKIIRQVKQKWTTERKPPQPATYDEIIKLKEKTSSSD